MENTQQKLGERDTCTPLGASQAQSSVAVSLNREETLSEHGLKTSPNSLDVNHPRHRGGSDLRVQNIVYVLNMRGQSLMPTTQQRANKILKQKRACVVQRDPFTIRLRYATGEAKQPVTLGVDAGYSRVGYSAVTGKREVISGELQLRGDVSRKLTGRRQYRRNRRNKLWHREPRFSNRKRNNGWLAPSMEHKLRSHTRLIEEIKEILPITKTVVEVASFDTQKMQNPEVIGAEYQQGELQGYEVREYLLEKWGRKCAYCNKKDIPLEVEHIIPKSRGGTNRVSNLTLACTKCNLEKGNKTAEEFGYPEIQGEANKSLKATPFMNLIRQRIVDTLGCDHTYGYVTKHNRIKRGLEKSHVNDAFVIAGGCNQERSMSHITKQVRRNNRSIQTNRKGFKPSIRKQRYSLQPNDLVKFNKLLCRVKGVFSYGKWVRIADPVGNIINSNIKNVGLVTYGHGQYI